MANIAEGFERDGNMEFRQFLSVAKGSAGEVRSHLYTALDVGLLSQGEFDELTLLAEQISRQLAAFLRYLQGSTVRGTKFR